MCTVIESTGSFATTPAYSIGSMHSISSLFSDPFFNPGFPPVSDTRGDFSADFVNVVNTVVPEPSAVAVVGVGGAALLIRRRLRR